MNLQDLAELDIATVRKLREAALVASAIHKNDDLTINDEVSTFQFMETVASKIPNKWHSVGIALGLTTTRLNAIDKYRRGDPLLCFSDVYDHWQQLSTSQQPANWASLATALSSNIVGENALALFIQKNFI